MKKRCICGRSTLLPLCDGSHAREGWRCGEARGVDVPLVFLASPSLVNVAERLAHRFEGVSANAVSEPLRAEQLVVISDGHAVAELKRQLGRITHERLTLIAVDQDPGALAWAFGDAELRGRADSAAPNLWGQIEALVSAPSAVTDEPVKPVVFLSHAVADEAAIYPAVRALREHYGLEVFVCADSIPAGSAWRREIDAELARCDVFLVLASEHANASVFCAFEAGCAVGLNKPIRVVCLDGQGPPAPLQDIQGSDVRRLLARKPWLEPSDAILEACLEAVRAPDGDRS